MARQEVNLYTLEFRQGQQPLSSRHVVQAAVATFVVLLIVEALVGWRLFANRDHLQELQAELQVVTTRVAQLKQSRPLSQRPQLEAKIASLREQVDRRQELRTIISGQNLGNAAGFSGQLQGMARQSVNDVALSEFRLLQGGAYVEFDGETLEPQAVPLFLQQLRQEESFASVRFGVISILREREHQRQMTFSVGQMQEQQP